MSTMTFATVVECRGDSAMTHLRRPCYGAILAVLAIPAIASACIWDYDTLKQERARFPDALEIITGKFLRHSKEFYEWRIQDRLKRIATDPKNANLHDDLAVAYLKTDRPKEAIATMLKVETFAPGRYETNANLSVFYFVVGDLERALIHVNKALEINPDAHFGREKYQKWLTEYVIESGNNFSRFIEKKLKDSGKEFMTKDDYQSAVKGVLGMMRFADHQSTRLLKALGDLLATAQYDPAVDAKFLAARAYLKASHQTLAEETIVFQTGDGGTRELKIDQVEKDFAAELAEAKIWYDQLHTNELRWIQEGLNPEEEFDKLYAEEPRVSGEIALTDEYRDPTKLGNAALAVIAGLNAFWIAAMITAVVLIIRWRRRRRHSLLEAEAHEPSEHADSPDFPKK